jgi:hypothetical protein
VPGSCCEPTAASSGGSSSSSGIHAHVLQLHTSRPACTTTILSSALHMYSSASCMYNALAHCEPEPPVSRGSCAAGQARCLPHSPVAAALQVWGSSRVPDAIAAEEIGTLTRLRDLKDLELNQCAPLWLHSRHLLSST